MNPKRNLWYTFDSIRCINLRTRPDRLEQASSVFDKLGIPIEWFVTDKHPNGGIQGCFESHISCIRESYLRGDSMCLIFEDDVIDTNFASDEKLLGLAIDFMETNLEWDLFYFGTCPDIKYSKFEPAKPRKFASSIFKMHTLCTHAYVVSRKFMRKIYDLKFIGVPIDYLYMSGPVSYGIYPSLFAQRASKSDISGDLWNLIPMKDSYFRIVELYAKHVNIPLIRVLLVLGFGFFLLLIVFVLPLRYRKAGLIVVGVVMVGLLVL